jgi:ABC-type proline/glycine betaine transport system permease subunit
MITSRGFVIAGLQAIASAALAANVSAQNLGDIVDVGLDFRKANQTLFAASRLTAFDPATGRGT